MGLRPCHAGLRPCWDTAHVPALHLCWISQMTEESAHTRRASEAQTVAKSARGAKVSMAVKTTNRQRDRAAVSS